MAYYLYWMEGLNFLTFSVQRIELMVLFFVSFVVKVFLVHSRGYNYICLSNFYLMHKPTRILLDTSLGPARSSLT